MADPEATEKDLRAEIRAVQAAGLSGDAAAKAVFAVMNGASAAEAMASAQAAVAASSAQGSSASAGDGPDGDHACGDARLSAGTLLAEAQLQPCSHYPSRGCVIIAQCCGQPYGCRLCHDEAVGDDHKIDRRATRLIACRECHLVQPASNRCENYRPAGDGHDAVSAASDVAPRCSRVQFDDYYCPICHMWIDKGREAFHCDGCGICRVGGAENYFHCHNCGMCLASETQGEHEGSCRQDRFKTPCPVCQEDLFSSRDRVKMLRCGHTIHCHCSNELLRNDYRCPVCRKSAFDMSQRWNSLRHEIIMTPLPAELQRTVNAICYDCGEVSNNVPWHVFGVDCSACGSFNTSTTASTEPASEPSDSAPILAANGEGPGGSMELGGDVELGGSVEPAEPSDVAPILATNGEGPGDSMELGGDVELGGSVEPEVAALARSDAAPGARDCPLEE